MIFRERKTGARVSDITILRALFGGGKYRHAAHVAKALAANANEKSLREIVSVLTDGISKLKDRRARRGTPTPAWEQTLISLAANDLLSARDCRRLVDGDELSPSALATLANRLFVWPDELFRDENVGMRHESLTQLFAANIGEAREALRPHAMEHLSIFGLLPKHLASRRSPCTPLRGFSARATGAIAKHWSVKPSQLARKFTEFR